MSTPPKSPWHEPEREAYELAEHILWMIEEDCDGGMMDLIFNIQDLCRQIVGEDSE